MRSLSPRLRASAALLVATAGVTALGALGTSAYAATPSDNARAETLAQQAYTAATDGNSVSDTSTSSTSGHTGNGYTTNDNHTAAALAQSAYSNTTSDNGSNTTHSGGSTGTTTHTQAAPTASSAPTGSAQSIAAQIVPADQLAAFDQIISHESGWNVTATNPSSGAYGLAQSLPGNKMASAGSDWQTNPTTQINWALNYMNTTYGSPNQAWSFWQNNSWY